jgi:hypothetical protein
MPTASAPLSVEPPKPETTVVNGQTFMRGFDIKEFGGNDAACSRTELEGIQAPEVVGSPNEDCKIVVEWSLKHGDRTIYTGVFPLEPGKWFYMPLGVAGVNDDVRIVGTAWYLPKGWNAHQFAADLAKDRDARDKTTSIIGLSPTDPYVLWLAERELRTQ